MTGTREGRPLCDEQVDTLGALCDSTVFRDGKCALHWGRPAQSKTPPPPAAPVAPRRDTSRDRAFRSGREVERLRGMETMDDIWWHCRRWDRLYDATLRRHDDREGRAT